MVGHCDDCSRSRNETYLVELQRIQEIVQFSILLSLLQFEIVLLQPMKGQLRLVIDVNLQRLW